jgi:hypothetical protein
MTPNNPSQTGTKQAQENDDRGIVKVSDPTRHRAPWKLSIYFNGKCSRTYHPTLAIARKAKATAQQMAKRSGTDAHSYDRASHAEYEAAKKLAGSSASLVDIVKFYTERTAKGDTEPVPTVSAGIQQFIERKRNAERATKTVATYTDQLRIFEKAFGPRLVSSITRNEILDWLLTLKSARDPEKNLSARSTSNAFGAVKTFMRYAEDRSWVTADPCRKINRKSDLPTIKKGEVGILTVPQAHALLRMIEARYPRYIHWAVLKYFVGVRFEEAQRFHGEWIDAERKVIKIPGWYLNKEDGELTPGSKTRDSWTIDAIAPQFWEWIKRYPVESGQINFARERTWTFILKRMASIQGEGRIEQWPMNGWRHSFATYDLSLHRDMNRTALILRHQSPRKLNSNYLGTIVSKSIAAQYFMIKPKIK